MENVARYRVQVLSGGHLVADYPAPFEAAARSLAGEVTRRLTSLPGLAVIVRGRARRAICMVRGTLDGWQWHGLH